MPKGNGKAPAGQTDIRNFGKVAAVDEDITCDENEIEMMPMATAWPVRENGK